jgi:hypothetical protein
VVFQPRGFFDGIRYVGRVHAVRATYFVYDANRRYLLVWPSRRSTSSYYASEIPRRFVDLVHRRFRTKTTTSVEVRRRLGGPRFRQLGALICLAALGKARVRGRRGRTLAFRILA